MPLEDIRRLIAFCDTPEQNCAEVNALLAAQLDRVRQRVRALRALASELEQLQGVCNEPGLARQCRILMTLSTTKRRGSP
jgi:DNA-binding transcriptional MerR regulator